MSDATSGLSALGDFMPHGCCYLWTPSLIWLHVISDALIAAAYCTIPLTLIHLVRQRRDLTFDWVLIAFGIFILACGATHLMEVITVWHPLYWASGGVKVVTALASVTTAILLVRLVPQLVAIPNVHQLADSNQHLADEIKERTKAQSALSALNEHLEERIRQRTADLQQSNLALRSSEQRYRMIVETAEEGIWLVDAQWRTTFANAKLGAMLGWTPEEMLGRSIFDFSDDEGRRIAEDNTRRRERGISESHEFKFVRRDGSVMWALLATNPIRDASGNHIGALAMVSDITERKRDEARLVESEQRYRELFASNPQPMWLYRADDLRFVEVNDAAVASYGYSREEFLGMSIRDIRPDERQPDLDQALRELESSPSQRTLTLHRRRDGSLIDVEVASHQLGDRKPTMRLVMALDVSARIEAERAITTLNAELEQRVRERTAQLTSINRELESFCYSISHDLRTPLRAINGFCQVLLEDCVGQLDATAQSNFQRIRVASLRMATLIDDLLSLSRLSRAELRRTEVDLSALAASAIETIAAGDPQRRVDVRIAPGLRASGDAVLLRVVLENLLGNAWKFTARNPEPSITLTRVDTPEGPAFVLRDNGVGFAMEHAAQLFGAFQRLHTVEEFPGTGIGLASVKGIVERHGGRIWASSSPGLGAAFFFTLPD